MLCFARMDMIEKHYRRNENSKKKTLSISNNDNNTDKNQTINFLWIPKIGQKSKKQIQTFGFRVAFQMDLSANNILCKNKDTLIPNSYRGVHELKYSCSSVHNGETKRKSLVGQQRTNRKASKANDHPLEQPNTQRDARTISTRYTPTLCPLKIGTMIEK